MLRSLGSTPGQVLALILGEAVLLGVMGVAIGILAGYWTAVWNLEAVSSTLTNVYMLREIESLELSGRTLALAVFAGLGGRSERHLAACPGRVAKGHADVVGHLAGPSRWGRPALACSSVSASCSSSGRWRGTG